jgi:gliding motility-associated-like protein
MGWISGIVNLWADLTNSQWVSFRDAQGSPIAKLVVLPNSDALMNKTEALDHLGLNAAALSGLAANQLITKYDMDTAKRATAWRPVYPYCVQTDPPVYYNVLLNKVFIRDNCGRSYNGTSVTYTVAANVYSSLISQEDADGQALSLANTNGQAYANSNGSCTIPAFFSSYMAVTAVKNDCGAGQTGSNVETQAVGRMFNSDISQSDANNKALAYLNGCKQANANAQGTCSVIPQVSYPEGMSPNGDGINDTLRLINLEYYPDNHVYVYSRAGSLVYDAAGYHNAVWNGRWNNTGGLVPTGSYYYIVYINGNFIRQTNLTVLY